MKNIVIFGAPGAGKGTQSDFIVERFGLQHISTGELLRKEIADRTALGLRIKDIMDAYRQISYTLFPHGFLHSGVSLLMLITLMMARWPLNRKESWIRILPVLSIFAYNFGTMFMLTSWQDGARFFHYSLWVMPVLAVMLVRKDLPVEGDAGEAPD